MSELLILFLMIYICIILVTFVWSFGVVSWQNDEEHWLNASIITLYDNTRMNMFGCIMCSIVLFIANYLYCTISCIIHLVYWISHVGRKDDNSLYEQMKEDIK